MSRCFPAVEGTFVPGTLLRGFRPWGVLMRRARRALYVLRRANEVAEAGGGYRERISRHMDAWCFRTFHWVAERSSTDPPHQSHLTQGSHATSSR